MVTSPYRADPSDDPHTTQDWKTRADCRNYPSEYWFPDNKRGGEFAKSICRHCPVRERCLAYSLINGETFGIWGGVDAEGRAKILGKKSPK